MMNLEHIMADFLLDEPKEVKIAGCKMLINKPTVSTMIAASRYIGKLPHLPEVRTVSDEFEVALGYGEECGKLMTRIIAILMIGAKGRWEEKKIFGYTYRRIDRERVLAEHLASNYSNKDLEKLLVGLLGQYEMDFFLRIIISLNRANLLKQTKRTEATAH